MKLIDKEAVVAEIRRRLERLANTSAENDRQFAAIIGAQHYELMSLIQYINTLEVKEVGLNEEIESYFKGFGRFASVGIDDCIDIAKHFFELGMKVSNKAQKSE